jgi:hypothetical protein
MIMMPEFAPIVGVVHRYLIEIKPVRKTTSVLREDNKIHRECGATSSNKRKRFGAFQAQGFI